MATRIMNPIPWPTMVLAAEWVDELAAAADPVLEAVEPEEPVVAVPLAEAVPSVLLPGPEAPEAFWHSVEASSMTLLASVALAVQPCAHG